MNRQRRRQLTDICDSLSEALDSLSALRDEENDALEAVPENLQTGDRYDEMEETAEALENLTDDLGDLISNLSELL